MERFFLNYCWLVWAIIFIFSFVFFKFVPTIMRHFCSFLKRKKIPIPPLVHTADLQAVSINHVLIVIFQNSVLRKGDG